MLSTYDLCIIGAGPAGMSAAVQAQKLGLSILLLDRQPSLGGQIFRGIEQTEVRPLGKEYAQGQQLAQAVRAGIAAKGIDYLPQSTVWGLQLGQPRQLGHIYVSWQGQSQLFFAKQIILATGAYERPVPIPGSTIPGVMGVGACDGLLKSAGLKPQGSVIVYGNGPLLIQSLQHLLSLQVQVKAVVFTGSLFNLIKAIPYTPAMLLRPQYFAAKSLMTLQVLCKGIPVYLQPQQAKIIAQTNSLTLQLQTKSGEKNLNADHIFLHEGVIPDTQATRLLQCEHEWQPTARYWQVKTNSFGQTNIPGILVAGDAAGILGGEAAKLRGHLAVLWAAWKLNKINSKNLEAQSLSLKSKLLTCKAGQHLLDKVFAPQIKAILPPDASLVCRCEEITAGQLRQQIQSGCQSSDGLKAQTRAGMGPCQGRMCSLPVLEILSAALGIEPDQLNLPKIQMPLFPLPAHELIDLPAADPL